jgi:hypothetical protein
MASLMIPGGQLGRSARTDPKSARAWLLSSAVSSTVKYSLHLEGSRFYFSTVESSEVSSKSLPRPH